MTGRISDRVTAACRRLPLLGIAAWLVACVLAAVLLDVPAQAQGDPLASAANTLAEVEGAIPGLRGNYDALLALRNRVEPVRNDLRERLRGLEIRRSELQAEIGRLGAKPQGAEEAQIASDRSRLAAAQATADAETRGTQFLSQQAEALWNRLTEMRRTIFSTRLLMHVASIVDPFFWMDVADRQLATLKIRTVRLLDRWERHVRERETLLDGIVLLVSVVAILVGFGWFHRVIRRRRQETEARTGPISPLRAVRRGAIILLMRAAPLPIAAGLIDAVTRRLDVAPDDIEAFLLSGVVALFVVAAARGAAGALLSPNAPQWRIVKARNETARIVYGMIVRAVDIYTFGLLFVAYQRLITTRLPLEIATVMLTSAAMVATTFWGLWRLGRDQGPAYGFVDVKAQWLRPLFAVACFVCSVALLFGYVSFAGFLSGRLTLSAGLVCAALYVVIALDHVFDRHRPSETSLGLIATRSFGITGHSLDVLGTALSGAVRFIVIVVTGAIVLLPWGLEYGDVNPLSDFSTFGATSDLRNSLGSFGFAILAFIVGIAGTRVVVGWLDGTLLPRMSFDESLRHSIRTVLGYAGFVATALITLSLMGINAQNVAVVAGALSVGIGFGLQSIVSNFVSGLIVLAERPCVSVTSWW